MGGVWCLKTSRIWVSTPQIADDTDFFRCLVGVGQNQDFQDELVGSGQKSVNSGRVLSLSCLNRGFSRIRWIARILGFCV